MRAERGMKRPDLAEATGTVSYTHLSEIENGKKGASGRTLEAIAGALGVRPHEILARADSLLEGPAPAEPAAELSARSFPAAAPSRRLRRAERSAAWFHDRATTESDLTESRPMAAASSALPDEDLSELIRIANELSPDDRERLLDLARRLRG
jgi:transcriptional regulator with XRE-family HTH domain